VHPLEAALNVQLDGGFVLFVSNGPTDDVWTGATAPRAPGASWSTCEDWTSTSSATATGYKFEAGWLDVWSDQFGGGCSAARRIFCFEQ
jgi:hypothetical protein